MGSWNWCGGSDYMLPVASAVTLGGVRIGDNINIAPGGNGIISIDNYVNADTGGTLRQVLLLKVISVVKLWLYWNATIDGTLDMGGLITFADGQTFPGTAGAVDQC